MTGDAIAMQTCSVSGKMLFKQNIYFSAKHNIIRSLTSQTLADAGTEGTHWDLREHMKMHQVRTKVKETQK